MSDNTGDLPQTAVTETGPVILQLLFVFHLNLSQRLMALKVLLYNLFILLLIIPLYITTSHTSCNTADSPWQRTLLFAAQTQLKHSEQKSQC